ncbi:Ribonuclease H-like domain containing protein, partial [Trema orientale]
KRSCYENAPSGSTSGSGGNRKDPAWNHSVEVEVPGEKKHYKYLECNYCKKVITGGVKRMKDHLAHTKKNVAPCKEVPEYVKKEFMDYLKKGAENRHFAQAEFDERVDSGAYFGSVMDGGARSSKSNPQSHMSSTRGVRGPMDRFIVSLDDDDEDVRNKASPIQRNSKEMWNQVCLDIGRFFFENAISFNAARSPSFFSMCRSIGSYGRGLKPPSMYELRTWILKEELKTTENIVDEIKRTWPQTGVSIMSDGWKDGRQRNLINFLVNNPSGTVFLKSVDASEYIKDAKLIFKLLDDVIAEVGEHLVVQVITDNASNYKAAGEMLMEKRKHLYWTPCAAHCIDLMLERIGELPQHKNALLKARKVANYIYNHSWLLALMRKFTKREIIRPAVTRFATTFLTLQSMHQVRQPLEAMFTSEEWIGCAFANKSEGKAVRKIILKDKTFWPSVVYAIKTTKPLVEVLRLVDAEKEPAMGYLYNAMDVAKEKIANNLGGEEKDYKEI